MGTALSQISGIYNPKRLRKWFSCRKGVVRSVLSEIGVAIGAGSYISPPPTSSLTLSVSQSGSSPLQPSEFLPENRVSLIALLSFQGYSESNCAVHRWTVCRRNGYGESVQACYHHTWEVQKYFTLGLCRPLSFEFYPSYILIHYSLGNL